METYYWEKNLETVKKYRRGMIELLSNCEDDNNIEVRRNDKGEFVPFYNKNPLYPYYDVSSKINEIIKQTQKELKKKVILVFGFGFGYLVEKILDYIPKDTILITVDPDFCLLEKALKYRKLTKIIKDQRVVFGNLKQIPKDISRLLYPYIEDLLIGGLGIFIDPSTSRYKSEFYKELKKELINFMRTMSVHFNTLSMLEFAFVQNTFFNASEYVLSPGIQVFKNKFKNTPAIVVSAGPSLNKNIAQIKYAKGKAIIIGVGPTLKPLLKHGIVPDFIVAIDPVDLQIKMFEGVEEETKNSILVTMPFFNYKALRLWKGKIVWIGKDDPLVNFFDEVSKNYHDKINTGMTVAHAAFSFANYIDANPIILVGQDLSYPTNKTHVDGAPLVKNIKIDPKKAIWVPGNVEEKVLTVRNFFSFIYLFREMAETIKKENPSKILINATEGGAKIDGFEIMTFREVLKEYILDKKISSFPDIPKYINIDKNHLFKEMNTAITDFYVMSEISYNLIKKIKKLSKKPTLKDIKNLNKLILDEQKKIITKKYFILIKQFFDIYERKKKKREKDLAEKYKNRKDENSFIEEVSEQKKKSITYYSEIFAIVNFFGNMMEFARDRIKEKLKTVDINNERR